MIFLDNFQHSVDTSLRPFEKNLKSATKDHKQCDPSRPHALDEVRDIIKKANQNTHDMFAELLIEQDLEENLFFHSDTDVEIYQHLRYLPAYWHSHRFIEIACVVQGNCTNYILNEEIKMQEGDFCIIAPNTRHAISAFTDDCILLNIILRVSTFETAFFGVLNENDVLSDFFMHTLYNSSGHSYILFRTNGDHELSNFIGYAHQEFQRNRQYKNRMLISIINAFFITLLRNHGTHVILSDEAGVDNENTVLILKYLQEHYNTVTLSELASFFNYSERQIQRIIKNTTGVSFSENVQKLKFRQAAHMLQNPDLPIMVIAEKMGYVDPANFRHIFKKYYGVTPSEYRSANRTR